MVRLRPGTPLARGTYCVLEDGLHWRSARIPHSLLDAISADLSQSGRGGHCHHPFAVLMLITAWGDRETLSQDRCTILYPAVGGSLGRWLPSPEVRQALDGLRLGAQYPQRRPDGTIVR